VTKEKAIEVKDLCKAFKDTLAACRISFDVLPGEIFGLSFASNAFIMLSLASYFFERSEGV
jgi:ABC-type phosphonate transport system ATPase subunit